MLIVRPSSNNAAAAKPPEANPQRSKLPPILFSKHMFPFLKLDEQAKFMQTARFARDIQRSNIALLEPLKREIEGMPMGGRLLPKAFQSYLIKLITSLAAGSSAIWSKAMDAMMEHAPSSMNPPSHEVDNIIRGHAELAHLLATSKTQLSKAQVYLFCKYLALGPLDRKQPWIGYRSLEQYYLHPQLKSEGIQIVMRELLTAWAKIKLNAKEFIIDLYDGSQLRIRTTAIDPRAWFGSDNVADALWKHKDRANRKPAPLPELFVEVLWNQIKSQTELDPPLPLYIEMTGKAEANLPNNFTLPLAKLMSAAGIFFDHRGTVNIEELPNSDFAHGSPSVGHYKALIKKYPASRV